MLIPLDKMQEVVAGNETRPSLHPSRMEKMVFVHYTPPPLGMDDRAEYDAWMERVGYLCDDLHWLLQLPHDKFWCQVVFDETLHKALDSFLHHCPRSYDSLVDLPEGGKQRQVELCRLVFMTYVRMSTHKESKEYFITPEVFGEILYENFLFDVPKLLDICSLFGKGNPSLMNKMVTNIFTQQPKYTDDLRETVPTILQVLSNIAAKCGVHLEGAGHTPQKLDTASAGASLLSLPISELQDVLLYLSDTAITLHRFLDIYPPACHVFDKFQFCSVIANFYECMIPELTSAVKQMEFPSDRMKKQLTAKLQQTRKSLLAVFHSIIQYVCLHPVLENGSNEEVVNSCIEEFLHTMTSVLGERRFLAAHEGLYSFQDDVDLLLQASSCIDVSQFEYIQSAINSAFATFGHRKSPRGDTNTGGRTSPDGAVDSSGAASGAGKMGGASIAGSDKWGGARPKAKNNSGNDEFQTEDYGEGAVSCPRPSEIEIESLITSVKDLLPHLGEGFIELALEELDWDQEKVVSCILEDKLPPSLLDISPDLPRQKRDVNEGDGQTDYQDILDSRKNVFDNDEFDVFRNKSVDLSKAHVGKKQKKVDLDDKKIVDAVRATYEAYGSMDKDSIYDTKEELYEVDQMYDDEYDDTYDSHAVGADDADSADELTNKTILPRVLMDLERKKAKGEKGDDDNDDDEEKEDDRSGQGAKDEFVANPAKLREQAEQRRQSQAARGRRGRGGGGPPKNRDVVGSAKGQGQSDEVRHNRRMKEKFKGQRNRANAEKKMSKGMF